MTNKEAIEHLKLILLKSRSNKLHIVTHGEEIALELAIKALEEERPQGEWIITAEDNEGIHRIQCPFCRYEKGSDFIDYIIVTFEKLPPFCESCGAELRGGVK